MTTAPASEAGRWDDVDEPRVAGAGASGEDAGAVSPISPGGTGGWPAGVDRVVLAETDSTMLEARRRAEALHRPVWILARRQTAARGRRGRRWACPAGNLAATLVMRPGGPAGQAALRSFSMAEALRRTLAQYVSERRLALKWPNDVLLDGGKVAGILLECWGRAGGCDWLAIGVGVNLAAAPAAEELEPGALPPVALDPPVSAADAAAAQDQFLRRLAGHFAELERLYSTTGFGAIRDLWLRHAARLGQAVTARLPHEDVTGTFQTIDADGCLVLRTAAGPRVIAAADVHFPRG